MENMPLDALQEVASYFQLLSEPTRLQILNQLRHGERKVGELADACGFTPANISRHLHLLSRQGWVRRRAKGTSVYYEMADPSVYALCDLVCGHIAQQHARTVQRRDVFRMAP